MSLYSPFSNLNKICRRIVFIPRRFTSKKELVSQKLPTQYALEHFDLFYRPVYAKIWPSIRIALLTTSKFCAVLNNFTDTDEVERRLLQGGAYDIIQKAAVRLNAKENQTGDKVWTPGDSFAVADHVIASDSHSVVDDTHSTTSGHSDDDTFEFDEIQESDDPDKTDEYVVFDERKDLESLNLQSFMPAKTVYTDTQQLRLEELDQNLYTPSGLNIKVVPGSLSLPNQLRVLTYPKGSTKEFANRHQHQQDDLASHFLMTASSVLPVVALDLQPTDCVLDLCAAPGGKALTLLQTLRTESVEFNDTSVSRLRRLQTTLASYTPEETYSQLTFHTKDGISFQEELYDKVLVDVPCSADRQIVTEDKNNFYMPSLMKYRVEMIKKQKDLLVAAIKSCVPGGSVVYCTGTLSPTQNDGIVQQAFEEIWRQTNIDVVVEDLEPLSQLFSDTYTFYTGFQYGQLVLPDIVANFGPMYFCKINRLT